MLMFQDNLTILIQGPLSSISLEALDSYTKIAKVVISGWSPVPEDLQNYLKVNDHIADRVRIELNDLPDIKSTKGVLTNSTFFYALKSMLYGLEKIQTDLVIKTRSDERFSTFEPFIEKFSNPEKKIVCGNIFVRNDISYHFGDHVFMCKTAHLYGAVKKLVKVYDIENPNPVEGWAQQGPNCAETILGKAILLESGVELTEGHWKNLFTKYFDIVNINDLEEFVCSWQAGNKTYVNKFKNPHQIGDLNDY